MTERAPRIRVCWPDPDATCLEGGCLYCEDHPPRSVKTIERYARQAGRLPNRYGGGTTDAMEAFRYGVWRAK